MTLLDSDTCPPNSYKPMATSAGGGTFGAVLAISTTGPMALACYEDCNKVYAGMENCGWLACATDGGACGGTIMEMGLDII